MDFAEKQRMLVKNLKKIDARASEFRAGRWHRSFVFDQHDEIRKNEGTARNLCCVGFIVILNTFFLDSWRFFSLFLNRLLKFIATEVLAAL